MTGDRARQHNYYCTARQQAIIARRAKKAGMSRSAFMVACALHDEPAGAELMPAPEEHYRQSTAGLPSNLEITSPTLSAAASVSRSPA